MIYTTHTREKDTKHTIYMWHYVLFSGMGKRKTHLTIKASRSQKKDLRLGRRKEAPLIPRFGVKWPSLLDVIASPHISVKKKQQTSPIKLTDRKRTFWSRSPGSPLCKGTPHGHQKHPQSHQQRSGYVVVRLVHFFEPRHVTMHSKHFH